MVAKEMCNKFCLLNRDAENVERFSDSCLRLVYNGLFRLKKKITWVLNKHCFWGESNLSSCLTEM